MLISDPTIASVLSIALVIIGIVLLVLIVSWIGRFLIRLIVGLIVNTILGFVVLIVINFVLGLAIPWSTPVIISVALFGLPAVGTIVILKLLLGSALVLSGS